MRRKPKHARRKPCPIPAKRRKRNARELQNRRHAQLYALPERHTSYETALLKNIVAGRDSGRVSGHAQMFYSLMANTTPSMRTLNFRHGIAVGRSLYRLYAQTRNYALYEESVGDLVSFFEHAGYGRITYHAFPNMIRIGMHDTLRLDLGMNTHLFEAGMIEGFLTASRGQLVHVTERACSSNSADSCEFCSSSSTQDTSKFEVKGAFDAFIEDVSRHVLRADEQQGPRIANEYYALSSLMLLDSKYFREIRAIADYLGSRLATELALESMTPRRMLDAVERSVELLNMGIAKIKTSNKFDITLQFGRLHSRKEFADLSIAFLHGLLRNASKGSGIKVKCLIHKNLYSVRISKNKPRKKVH